MRPGTGNSGQGEQVDAITNKINASRQEVERDKLLWWGLILLYKAIACHWLAPTVHPLSLEGAMVF